MKSYVVGGAVRDELLGLPVKDRDWVVVGATPEEMAAKGFKPGVDFYLAFSPERVDPGNPHYQTNRDHHRRSDQKHRTLSHDHRRRRRQR